MIWFLLAPLVIVNIWHGMALAIAGARGQLRQSISDSVLTDIRMLWMHRLMHTVAALSLMVYSRGLLEIPKLQFAGMILIAAAVFDIVQSWTLSRQTHAGSLDLHHTHVWTAWTMACGYLAFALVCAYLSNLYLAIVGYVALLVLVYVWSKTAKHRYFWLAQMVFFVATSVMIVLAGVTV